MSDQRVGAAFRAVRLRRGWRQLDVATRAGFSHTLISSIERGHVDRLSLRALREIATVLEIRIDVLPRWRAGELDRLLNAHHAALAGLVIDHLSSLGWEVLPEVSFAIYGERGFIDLLAWHAATHTLLVIELKTEIVDISELVGIVDRKVRLAPQIASQHRWAPASVGALLVVSESSTNRRRVAQHGSVLRAAFPMGGNAVRAWLKRPYGRFAGLMFLSSATGRNGRARQVSPKRVRKASASVS